MPKLLPVLTSVAAMSACTALVLAQESAPAEQRLAVTAVTADEAAPSAHQAVYPSESDKPGKPTPTPTPKPAASAEPATLPSQEADPASTPKPHKPSFFERIFGSRRPKPTPYPTPDPTPPPSTHRSTRKPSSTPVPAAAAAPKPGRATPPVKKTEKPVHGAKFETQSEATTKPESPTATPKPEKTKPEKVKVEKTPSATPAPSSATPPPKKTSKTKTPPVTTKSENPPPEPPPADADPEAREKYRFEVAKSKAVEDAQVQNLKTKADDATTEEESKKALRAYNKALFEKIRKIDPSVSEFSNSLEAAMLKRLGE